MDTIKIMEGFSLANNREIFIVAGGPSLRKFDWDYLLDKNVMAINRAYETCPNASHLYFCDERFWEVHKGGLTKHNAQFKITARRKPMRVKYPESLIQYEFSGLKGYDARKGYLRTGNNSGYAAISLCAQLGYKSIYLLGYDMNYIKGKSHWHDGHTHPAGHRIHHKESTLSDKMLPFFQELKDALDEHVPDCDVINLNKKSAIRCFDFGDLPV